MQHLSEGAAELVVVTGAVAGAAVPRLSWLGAGATKSGRAQVEAQAAPEWPRNNGYSAAGVASPTTWSLSGSKGVRGLSPPVPAVNGPLAAYRRMFQPLTAGARRDDRRPREGAMT
jgi:hypothetical protein